MREGENDHAVAERAVRDSLAVANRLRRAREAGRRMWQAAPYVAGGAVCLALAGYVARWPPVVPLGALGAGTLGLLLYFLFGRRARPVSDATASEIDREAGLGGELRSARWFAARARRDDWAEFHLASAATRLKGIDWATLYPPVRPLRARLATAALALTALALALVLPPPAGTDPVAASAQRRPLTGTRDAGEILPPELQRQLEALLAAVERGDLPRAAALANDPALAGFLQGITHLRDRELLEALSRALASKAAPGNTTAAQDMSELAERARRAADAAPLPDEMKSALEKLASELDVAKVDTMARSDGAAPDAGPAQGDATAGAGGMDQISIQFEQQTGVEGGQGMILMSGEAGKEGAGSPGAGVGGSGSGDAGASPSKRETAAALRREIVEAGDDHQGANVQADVRRKTEHGEAALAYTRSATRTFDPTRAVAPPPLPESRRSGVQTYFHRTP